MRDFRPVFWTHRDPLVGVPRLSGALCVRQTRDSVLAHQVCRRPVTAVSTGRPLSVCKQLPLRAKNCNQINNLGDFCQILAFLAILRGRKGRGPFYGLAHPSLPARLSAVFRVEIVLRAQQLVEPRLDIVLSHLVDVRIDVEVLAPVYRQTSELVQLFDCAHRCVVRTCLEAGLGDLP